MNLFFELNNITKQLSNCFQDIDPGRVDHEFFSQEAQLAFQKSEHIEDFFKLLIKQLHQQQDKHLVDSRTAINKALAKITSNHVEFNSDDDSLKVKLNISDSSWTLGHGQIMLLCTNAMISSELYQHLLFDLAVHQHMNLLSFIEESKHDSIIDDLMNSIRTSEKKEALNFNTKLIQLKNSKAYVEETMYHSPESFEEHLKHLCRKYKTQVVYIDDISIIDFNRSHENNTWFNVGEYLLSLANKLKLTIIFKYHHEFLKIDDLKRNLGSLMNYTAHVLQLEKSLSQEGLKLCFLDIIDLKGNSNESLDVYFNPDKSMIMKSSVNDLDV